MIEIGIPLKPDSRVSAKIKDDLFMLLEILDDKLLFFLIESFEGDEFANAFD